ncbi:YfjI family protein [Shewanella sp.]|uniref:YfjI family protein n=1 Tax=Shewanella sp. TaxID=50422 RepID=UPI003A983C6C
MSDGRLPELPNSALLSRAIDEARQITKAPDGMIVLTALSAVSTALQGVINVETPIGQICPVSLMALTIAESGERKSTVQNLFTQGIKEYQKSRQQQFQQALIQYEIELEDFKARKRQLKRNARNVIDNDPSQLASDLLACELAKPTKPISPKLTYEDCTIEALLDGLSRSSANAFLTTSEGAVVMNSRAMANTSYINSLWSGDDISVDRKSLDSFTLSDVRLSVHIMSQLCVVERFLKGSRDDPRGTGFLARFLVCAPFSTCGSRQISGVLHPKNSIKEFNEKIVSLLSSVNEMSAPLARTTVCFSAEAKECWIGICNDVERKMADGGIYEMARDHASKIPENVARLAALIHFFEYPLDSEISKDSLWLATELVSYFSWHFMRLFCGPSEDERNAEQLGIWLQTQVNLGRRYIKRNHILQYGPNCIRKKDKFDRAFYTLSQSWNLVEMPFKNTKVIDLQCSRGPDPIRLEFEINKS